MVSSKEEIIQLETMHDLPIIKPLKDVYKPTPYPFIGTFDLETFRDSDSTNRVYALGFTTAQMSKSPEQNVQQFYLGDDADTSGELILKCIDAMLVYKGHIFYVHNLGGYDGVFIMDILLRSNRERGEEVYKMRSTYKELKVLKLEISIKVGSKSHKLLLWTHTLYYL